MLRWSFGIRLSLLLSFISILLVHFPLCPGSVSAGYSDSTSQEHIGYSCQQTLGLMGVSVCCTFLIPLSLLLLDPPVGEGLNSSIAEVEIGPCSQDYLLVASWRTYRIQGGCGMGGQVSAGLPRWRVTGSLGHCWFLISFDFS